MGLLKSSKPFLLAGNGNVVALPPHPLEVEGQAKLAQYSIKRHLGKGNCATVKEALHIPSNTLCALKVISKRSIPNFSPELSRGRLLREMTILAPISHPNVIRVRDAFQTPDAYYIALELATGGVLFDRIAPSGRFTEKDAAVLLYSLVDALALLHDHDICHRDLKPDNIMFKTKAPDSPIVVMDFGVACTVRGDELLRTNIVGTPRYSAPEILHQRPHGKPCDMWSVGCIAYTLLCGFNPFHEAKTFPDIKHLVMQPVPFPQRYWSNISSNALGFISRCLTPDPDERLTARQALVHPWFVQFVDAARQVAKSILAAAPLDSTVINLDVTHLSDSAPPDMDNPYPMAAQLAQIVTAVPEALTTGIEIVDIPPSENSGSANNNINTIITGVSPSSPVTTPAAASPVRVYSSSRVSSMAVDIPRNSTHPRLVSLMSMSNNSLSNGHGGGSPHRVTTTHAVAALGHSWKSNASSGAHSPGQQLMNLHVSPSAVFRVDVQAGVEAPPVADDELPNLAEQVWDVAATDAARGSVVGTDDEEEEEEDGLVMVARGKKSAPVAVPGGRDAGEVGGAGAAVAAPTGRSAGSVMFENYAGIVVMPEEVVVMSDVTVAGLDLKDAGNGTGPENGNGRGTRIIDRVEEVRESEEEGAGKWMRFSFLGRRTMLKKKK